ncbi:mannosyltransferase family protein [Streptacidiphilus sp. MAP5-3]|uniref:mannosyltransferase family protein n=1 Tax=unclassified Streptacidiphilus TaxID=2643834 RepID=UPI0035182400
MSAVPLVGPRAGHGDEQTSAETESWDPKRPVLRGAGQALLGYAGVRTVGLVVLALEAHRRGLTLAGRLFNWDSGWYLFIAERGYDQGGLATSPLHTMHSDLAFFPAFPYMMRFVHLSSPLSLREAGLSLSCVAAFAAAWGVYRTALVCHGHRAGVIAAMLWGMLPIAVVENMAYSESEFTALCAWALYCALADHWIRAGLLGCLAGLTRPSGVAVVAALGAAALVESARVVRARRCVRPAPTVRWWRPLAGAGIASAGWSGYVAWVGLRVHDLTGGYLTVQEHWGSVWDGGDGTFREFQTIFGSARALPLETVVVAGVVLAALLLLVVAVSGRQHVLLAVYSAGLMAIALGDHGYFMCMGRFLLPAFPLLFPAASALARARRRVAGAVLASGTVMSALFGGYLLLVWPLWP